MGESGSGRSGDARIALPTYFSRVLVVSGSRVFREVLRVVLTPHAESVLLADDRREGCEQLVRGNPVDVVICEVRLPDGDGFALLKDVALLAESRPEVALVAGRPTERDARRARLEGAAGYLAKPVSFRHIASALKQSLGRTEPRPLRRRSSGRVYLIGFEDQTGARDARDPQVMWYARDLSVAGAFLETEGPLPVGSELGLALEFGDVRLRLRAEVVRIQEPTWGSCGGVGVRFLDCGTGAKEALHAYVSDGGADTY